MSATRDFCAWQDVDQHVDDMNLSEFEERLAASGTGAAAGHDRGSAPQRDLLLDAGTRPARRQQARGADRDHGPPARQLGWSERVSDRLLQGRQAGRPAGAGEHQARAPAEALRRLGGEGVDQRRRAVGPVHPLHLHAAAAGPVRARERDPRSARARTAGIIERVRARDLGRRRPLRGAGDPGNRQLGSARSPTRRCWWCRSEHSRSNHAAGRRRVPCVRRRPDRRPAGRESRAGWRDAPGYVRRERILLSHFLRAAEDRRGAVREGVQGPAA